MNSIDTIAKWFCSETLYFLFKQWGDCTHTVNGSTSYWQNLSIQPAFSLVLLAPKVDRRIYYTTFLVSLLYYIVTLYSHFQSYLQRLKTIVLHIHRLVTPVLSPDSLTFGEVVKVFGGEITQLPLSKHKIGSLYMIIAYRTMLWYMYYRL